MTEHIAIVSAALARQILAGRKRIESRLSRTRRAPFGSVFVGDLVHFKVSGGAIIGTYRVRRVAHLRGLTPQRIHGLRRRYGERIGAPRAYWSGRRECRYAVLIWFQEASRFAPPPKPRRQYGNAWISLASSTAARGPLALRTRGAILRGSSKGERRSGAPERR